MRSHALSASPRGCDFVIDGRGRARRPSRWPVRPASLATSIAAVALLAGGTSEGLGSGLLAAGQAVALSAAQVFTRRSPGLRGDAFLYNIKHPRSARALPRPIPRIHRPIVRAPAPPPLFAPPPIATPLAFLDTAIAPTGPVNVTGPFPAYDLGESPCLCRFAYIPPSGGGGLIVGLPSGGGGGTVPPPGGGGGGTVPPPGIPEPGSWVTMILGFGVLGALWRRRRLFLRLLTYAPLVASPVAATRRV